MAGLNQEIERILLSITRQQLQKEGPKGAELPRVLLPGDCKPRQLANALNGFARGCAPDEVIVLVDTSVFGSGKTGVVFAADRLYASPDEFFVGRDKKSRLPMPLYYRELQGAEQSRVEREALVLTYRDGHRVPMNTGIYTVFYDRAISGILRLLRQRYPQALEPAVPEPAEPKAAGAGPAAPPARAADPPGRLGSAGRTGPPRRIASARKVRGRPGAGGPCGPKAQRSRPGRALTGPGRGGFPVVLRRGDYPCPARIRLTTSGQLVITLLTPFWIMSRMSSGSSTV